MALVFCIDCGAHDVCPMDMTGEWSARCDVCGHESIPACGKCAACNGEEADDGEYEDEDFGDWE